MIFLLVEHEQGDSPTLVGTDSGLSTDANSSMANAKLVGSSWDGMEGRRHLMRVVMEGLTEVVDGE